MIRILTLEGDESVGTDAGSMRLDALLDDKYQIHPAGQSGS